MSNLLEQLVWDLPKEQKDKIDKLDCHFSDGYCESIDVISDYIIDLERNLKEANDKIESLKCHAVCDCEGCIAIDAL